MFFCCFQCTKICPMFSADIGQNKLLPKAKKNTINCYICFKNKCRLTMKIYNTKISCLFKNRIHHHQLKSTITNRHFLSPHMSSVFGYDNRLKFNNHFAKIVSGWRCWNQYLLPQTSITGFGYKWKIILSFVYLYYRHVCNVVFILNRFLITFIRTIEFE